MVDVVVCVLRKNDYIVQVCKFEFTLELSEYNINCPLERGRGILKSEGHKNNYINAMLVTEGGLIAINCLDLHFSITTFDVQSLGDGWNTEWVYELVHSRDRVRVTNCYIVESSVSDAKKQRSVIIGSKKWMAKPMMVGQVLRLSSIIAYLFPLSWSRVL